jgi:hypothetical protein
MNKRPEVLIATPAYGNMVSTEYLMAVVNLLVAGLDARFGVRFASASFLPNARNQLATAVLNDPTYTHLLFIDADMGFDPSLIGRMLSLGEPFVGCIYPQREVDLGRVVELGRQRPDLDPRQIARASLGYIGELTAGGARRDGFAEAEHVGTGILLIQRCVLERMRDAEPALWLPNATHYQGVRGALQCFSSIRTASGIVQTEDTSFSLRWRQSCGGKIWACIETGDIVHFGGSRFVGDIAERLAAGFAQSKVNAPEGGANATV